MYENNEIHFENSEICHILLHIALYILRLVRKKKRQKRKTSYRNVRNQLRRSSPSRSDSVAPTSKEADIVEGGREEGRARRDVFRLSKPRPREYSKL